mgnify:CR=1 FL=1
MSLRNNILWAAAGFDITVASDSQQGFSSNYNLFYGPSVGQWQGVSKASLSSWRSAGFTDGDSLFIDPLFVDADGADNALGYVSTSQDGRDDNFHVQSLYGSFHGGSLAPVRGANNLPVMLEATEAADAASSPAIDRGALGDSFSNEPGPNGGYVNIGAYGNTPQASKSP